MHNNKNEFNFASGCPEEQHTNFTQVFKLSISYKENYESDFTSLVSRHNCMP